MSERVIAWDGPGDAPRSTIALVFDDGTPLLCTGIHAVNNGQHPIALETMVGGMMQKLSFPPGSDTIVALPVPLATQLVTTRSGGQVAVVPELSSGIIREGPGVDIGTTGAALATAQAAPSA